MAAITRDVARAAAAEVARANAEADRLEAETKAARERAAAASRTAQNVTQEFGRITASQRQAASNELEQLSAASAAMLKEIKEKPDKTRVTHDVRVYARSMLQNYVLGDNGPQPQLSDALWGRLHGIQGNLQRFMGRVEDEKLYAAADDLECRLHQACRQRLMQLAGEE